MGAILSWLMSQASVVVSIIAWVFGTAAGTQAQDILTQHPGWMGALMLVAFIVQLLGNKGLHNALPPGSKNVAETSSTTTYMIHK